MIPLSVLQSIAPVCTPFHLQAFERLGRIFLEKNEQINLSSFKTAEEVWNKHFFDSVSASRFIDLYAPKTILDMGTGGGFPTLPLALLYPHIEFFAVDSVQKKLKAVEEFAEKMGMKNVHVLWGRAEELAHEKKHREQYDMVVTRAFAHFSPMLEMTLPFLKNKSHLIAYRGPEHNEQDDELVLDFFGGFCEEVFPYTLPSGEARELWNIKKVEPTEKRFPRSTGIPKKEPVQIPE